MAEFLAMGGHGFYVWTAYGITVAVLAVNAIAAVQRHRHALKNALQDRVAPTATREATVRKL